MIKKIFTKCSFHYLAKGLDILLRYDKSVTDMLADVEDGTCVRLGVLGCDTKVIIVKSDGRLLLQKKYEGQADLAIYFKFFGSLPSIVFGSRSIVDCYVQDEFFIKGELRNSVSLVSAMQQFMAYLLPRKRFQKAYGYAPQLHIGKFKFFGRLLFGKTGVAK